VTLITLRYLKLQFLQAFSLTVFIVFKSPKDLFSQFNKCPTIQFSVFQYPHFFYAEQRLLLQRNKAIIEAKLASLNEGGKLIAVLDDYDIINAEETIKSQQLGIDLDFLVKRLGAENSESIVSSDD
jgi:hypothetical protein